MLQKQFAHHGIPDVFVSDNGPQFYSTKLREFSDKYQFKHNTSSPLYPQSNGKAEKAVQTVKGILKKALSDKKDFQPALLDFRNTPTNVDLGSPTHRLMGRHTKTLLPTTIDLLKPKIVHPRIVKQNLTQLRETQKLYYDQHAKRLPALKQGDIVMFQCGKTWKPAVIESKAKLPCSYIIATKDGQTYRRNRRHIRLSRAALGNSHEDLSDVDTDSDLAAPDKNPKATIVTDCSSTCSV